MLKLLSVIPLLLAWCASIAQAPLDTYLGTHAGFAKSALPPDSTSLQHLSQLDWQVAQEQAPNFDQGNETVWAKIDVPSSGQDLVLALESGMFREVVFVWDAGNGSPNGERHVSHRFEDHLVHDAYMNHTLTIPAEQTGGVVYVGVQTPRFRILPLRLATQQTYQQRSRNVAGFWAMFFGIIAVAVIYNLWYFFWFRDSVHLAYIGYAVSVAIAQGLIGGATGAFFFGQSEWWFTHDVPALVPLSVLGCVWFIVRFLDMKNTLPRMYKALWVLCASAVASLIVGVTTNAPFVYQWVNLNSLIGIFMAVGSCIYLSRKGNSRAMYFTVAWTLFLLGMTLYILKDFGVLPYTTMSVYSMPMGALMEMGLIAAILAAQIRDLRVSKDQISLKLSALEEQRRKENLNVQMAKLRSELLSNQMSPHFIFNVMSSIQVYIAQNDIEASVRYLGQYAKLMRHVLEGARKEEVTLEDELEMIGEYVGLESIRRNEPITYQTQVDQALEPDAVMLPAMVLQPLVENAIQHGFRGLSTRKPALEMDVRRLEEGLVITVRDNGVGLRKRPSKEQQKSLALTIIRERCDALRAQGLFDVELQVTDLREREQHGTEVRVLIRDLRKTAAA